MSPRNAAIPEVPPYQDLPTLARNLCAGEQTIEDLVAKGQFPRPKKLGAKRVWRWAEVVEFLEGPPSIDDLEGRITNATREAALRRRNGRRLRSRHPQISQLTGISEAEAED